MADPPNVVAGGVFYLLYPLGILLFAIAPTAWAGGLAAPADVPCSRAVLAGALFGDLAYATCDLSDLATLRGWPLRLALVDIAWGTTLTAAAASAVTSPGFDANLCASAQTPTHKARIIKPSIAHACKGDLLALWTQRLGG
jgi:uncharacterized membrane protein